MAGKVFFSVSMSLDGFIAPESAEELMGQQWMELQQWIFPLRFFRENLKLGEGGEEGSDNDILRETFERTGASVMGKRMFDAGEKMWPEEAPFHTPVFVVTHEKRDPWERPGGTTFHFVNDGIEPALDQAREAAGDRDVRIAGRRRGPRGPAAGPHGALPEGDAPDLRGPGALGAPLTRVACHRQRCLSRLGGEPTPDEERDVMRVFVAGGTGAIGRRLVPQLVARGHQVTATTTSAGKLTLLKQLGAVGVVMDGLDAASVGEAVAAARPDAIVHQMTGLSVVHAGKPDFRHPERFGAVTNRLRSEGTDHLLAAAEATGVPHVVAQSVTMWTAHRERGLVTEEEPMPPEELPAKLRLMVEPLRHVEDVVVKAGGAALRYGGFYGPGGGVEEQVDLVRKRRLPIIGGGTGYFSWVHIDDAASATVLAVEQQANGVFNIVDDEPALVSEWLPHLAACVGAKRPLRIPKWLVRPLAGEMGVALMTEGRPFSNAKAKRELGWELRYPTWRVGFKDEA